MDSDLVGFVGRGITDGMVPKYVNSAESETYKKSKILFGLDKSQDWILKSGYVILVEGQFDFLRLWGSGINNVVASSGTGLSRYQARLMRRFADYVVLCFDGDDAGRSASLRCADVLKEELVPTLDLKLPDGLDPDEFILQYGGLEFLKRINQLK